MQRSANIPGRHGTLGLAILVAIALAGCSPADAVTAPDVIMVAAKPATQGPVSARFDFVDVAGTGLSSDGVGGGQYRDTVCGVTARVFFLDPTYLDGNLQLDNSRALDRKCVSFGIAAYPRKLSVRYPDGVTQTNTGGVNVANMGTVASGSPELRSMGVRIAGTAARCSSLSFGGNAGGSQVLVTRVSATSWSVASQTGGTAVCVSPSGATSTIQDLAVAFTVTLN